MGKVFDLFEEFATDLVKEVEGVDVPLGRGASLKIARTGNSKFEALLLEELEKHAQALETLPKPEAEALDKEIYRRVVARTILVGWSGLFYKGEEIPYSPENAVKMIAMDDFRKLVMGHATKIDLFRAKLEVGDLKKSKKPSSTT